MQSSSPSTPQKIHDWASRSSDLISTVSTPRLSNQSSFCSHRPITPRSRFASHFHLACQWVFCMSDAMHDDINDGLRFRNCNCFYGMRASVRISNKRNENQYRLFQCCPKDACRFFQWCIPMKTPLSYAEEFQQLQEELCALRDELRVMHDKVHPLD
nr:hypothetical protein CFP56_40028 [Quercus suber]POF17160.1 hypothetical protein CFP56_39686 [Quercus suber]